MLPTTVIPASNQSFLTAQGFPSSQEKSQYYQYIYYQPTTPASANELPTSNRYNMVQYKQAAPASSFTYEGPVSTTQSATFSIAPPPITYELVQLPPPPPVIEAKNTEDFDFLKFNLSSAYREIKIWKKQSKKLEELLAQVKIQFLF
jgi:hypothetical protein